MSTEAENPLQTTWMNTTTGEAVCVSVKHMQMLSSKLDALRYPFSKLRSREMRARGPNEVQ